MSTIFSLRAPCLHARTRTVFFSSIRNRYRTGGAPSAQKRPHSLAWQTFTHSADRDSGGVPQTRPCATQMALACVRATQTAAHAEQVCPRGAHVTTKLYARLSTLTWWWRCGGSGDDDDVAPLATLPSVHTHAHPHMSSAPSNHITPGINIFANIFRGTVLSRC